MGVGGQHHAPAALPPGKDPLPIVQEVGQAPGPVWNGEKNLASTGIRSPDHPACSGSYMVYVQIRTSTKHTGLSAVCLATAAQPLPKPVLHRLRSSAPSFNWQYPLVCLRSSSSCLHLLPNHSLYLPFKNPFQKTVPTQDVTNPVALPSFHCL